jgi:endogenous inhibitor of DNA gyrase (YacG/DUF329 family)
MPRSANRQRTCQQCGKAYTLGVESSQHKYCSLECRNKWHYSRWKSSGNKRCQLKTKNYWLQHKYGISSEQKEEMLQKQGYKCAVCETTKPTKFGWHVDHCHTTNKIRGILCQFCNQLLGMAKDDVSILQQSIKYLNATSKTSVGNT